MGIEYAQELFGRKGNDINTIIFMIACLMFLLIFVGLPIVGIVWLIINYVDNKRNKRYLEWIEHLDKLSNEHIHYTREIYKAYYEK